MNAILCPVDFSQCSENAAEYAFHVAKEIKSRLILLNVVETPAVISDPSPITETMLESTLGDSAKESLNRLMEKFKTFDSNLKVETICETGIASNIIVTISRKEMVELVIMGNPGKGKLNRLFFGSTTSYVLSHSYVPVLLIPPEKHFDGVNRIVFATDLREDNLHAAMRLVPFAGFFKSEICFLNIDKENRLHKEREIEHMTTKIHEAVKYNKICGYISSNKSVSEGIEEFLRSNSADLVAMFTHQLHFPENILNASKTKKTAQLIKIPLLALPAHSGFHTDVY